MWYLIKKDGEVVARVEDNGNADSMPNAVFIWLHNHQGQSVHYAIKHGGYTWEKEWVRE